MDEYSGSGGSRGPEESYNPSAALDLLRASSMKSKNQGRPPSRAAGGTVGGGGGGFVSANSFKSNQGHYNSSRETSTVVAHKGSFNSKFAWQRRQAGAPLTTTGVSFGAGRFDLSGVGIGSGRSSNSNNTYGSSASKGVPYSRTSSAGAEDDDDSSSVVNRPPMGITSTVARTNKTAAETKERLTDVTLSAQQHAFFEKIGRRENVFISGAAGTGKSFVLRVLQEALEQQRRTDEVAFTAPTGVAACNIGGVTIHSWAGIGLGEESIEELCARVSRSREGKRNWKKTSVLIIDEVSMLSRQLFDKLARLGSRMRLNDEPFGGIQVIVCGDFFQLPPVGLSDKTQFCFESPIWEKMFPRENVIILDQVFRQKENSFLTALHEIRRGEVSQTTRSLLERKCIESSQGTSTSTTNTNSLGATKLFSTNRDVDRVNEEELNRLGGKEKVFHAHDEGPDVGLLKGMRAPEVLKLKVGAQVMLLKNLDVAGGLVNGTRGEVVHFERSEKRSNLFAEVPVVRFEVMVGDKRSYDTRTIIEESWEIGASKAKTTTRWQIPLMLAYAISIHKAQGMTIPLLEVSFAGMFEFGQAYVALSRATDWEGLRLTTFDARNIRAHKRVKDYYQRHGYEGEKPTESMPDGDINSLDDINTTTRGASTSTSTSSNTSAIRGAALVRTTVSEIAELIHPNLKRKEAIHLKEITARTSATTSATAAHNDGDNHEEEDGLTTSTGTSAIGMARGVRSASPSGDDTPWMVSKRMRTTDISPTTSTTTSSKAPSVSTKLTRHASREEDNMFADFICDDDDNIGVSTSIGTSIGIGKGTGMSKRDEQEEGDDWMEGASVARSRGGSTLLNNNSKAVSKPAMALAPAPIRPPAITTAASTIIPTTTSGANVDVPSPMNPAYNPSARRDSDSTRASPTMEEAKQHPYENTMMNSGPMTNVYNRMNTTSTGTTSTTTTTTAATSVASPEEAAAAAAAPKYHKQPASLLDMYRSQAQALSHSNSNKPGNFFLSTAADNNSRSFQPPPSASSFTSSYSNSNGYDYATAISSGPKTSYYAPSAVYTSPMSVAQASPTPTSTHTSTTISISISASASPGTNLTEEQKMRIEQNRRAAQERLAQNRRQRQEETDKFLNSVM